MQLIFETDNILFTKVSIKLLDEYLELVNDKTIQRSTLTKEKEYSKEKELAWIQNVLDNNELVFSMLDKNTNEFIGNISLDVINDESAEIALSIKSIMQNKGYGKEAIRGLIDYAKEVLHYKSLIAVIFSNNEKSLHCFQKLGQSPNRLTFCSRCFSICSDFNTADDCTYRHGATAVKIIL